MKNLVLLLGVGFGGVILILSLKFIQSLLAYRSRPISSDLEYIAAAPAIEPAKEERRVHARVRISLPVRIQTAQGAIRAVTKDLSLGGAFICCQNPLPLNEKFLLSIAMPHGDSLYLDAEVVWSNTNVPAEKVVNRGMGVRFLLITKADRMILNDLVSAQMGTTHE